MSEPLAELSSISSALDELSERIGVLAETLSNNGRDEIATELYEVERSLAGGRRRLSRIVHRR
jgi:hypothetical protein